MKITRNTLEQILQDLANILNLSASSEQAKEKGQDKFLELEYNSNYGGYRLVNVKVEHGGHSEAFGRSAAEGRISAKEMYQYLTGLLAGASSQIK